LQPYRVIAADVELEVGTAMISAVLLLDEHLLQANTSRFQKFYCTYLLLHIWDMH
jgi:hypothetical protein